MFWRKEEEEEEAEKNMPSSNDFLLLWKVLVEIINIKYLLYIHKKCFISNLLGQTAIHLLLLKHELIIYINPPLLVFENN